MATPETGNRAQDDSSNGSWIQWPTAEEGVAWKGMGFLFLWGIDWGICKKAEPAELLQEKSNEAVRLMWHWPLQETFFCFWGQWGRERWEFSMKEWEIGLVDMSFLFKPNCCVFSSFVLFFRWSNNLSGLTERVTKNICGLLSGVAVPVVLFSSRDWQKQLTEKRSALGSHFSGLYFPPRGCLAQVQGLGRGSIRSAVQMVFHLQGINEKVNGKNFRSYLWWVSEVIYEQGCDSILCILACLLMEMWWRKKARRLWGLWVIIPQTFSIPAVSSFQILDCNDFQALPYQMWIDLGYERLYSPISNPLNYH